ncbi:MAG: hypothetical protein VX370_02505 [Bacteroidota bacterium]|nr:hypothetical protein [Bacteroidota bacterium]
MKKLLLILLCLPMIGFTQVQLLPSIGLLNEPNDYDSVCNIVARNQGNSWNPINAGDTMADFKLWNINGDSIILSDVLNSGKRVLMVSGSYTCPIFRDHMTELNAVSAQFGNQIECFVVYTVEAHPTGSPMPYSGNINPTNPPYYQPNTYGERKANLQDMLNGVNGPPSGNYIPVPVNVPIYIDGPCNAWWEYYNGPNNAYLIDTNGVLFAYHNWFSNSNPPNGQATNIWCDIDSLLSITSGGCNQVNTLNGTFNFQLKPSSTPMNYGNPGDIIDIFGEIINTSNSGVQVDIRRMMNNLPSNTWTSSMCIGVCLPPNQDTASAIVAAGDTLDFSFHFFTDPLMAGPDTGRSRVRFSNNNGSQQVITQNYRGITYTQATNILQYPKQEKQLDRIVNIMGQRTSKKSRKIQIYIYEDGSMEKRIIIE